MKVSDNEQTQDLKKDVESESPFPFYFSSRSISITFHTSIKTHTMSQTVYSVSNPELPHLLSAELGRNMGNPAMVGVAFGR